MENNKKFGRIVLNVKEIAYKKGLSKNKLSFISCTQRPQIIKYYKDEITRIDTNVLARLCYALDCEAGDILKYIPYCEDETTK